MVLDVEMHIYMLNHYYLTLRNLMLFDVAFSRCSRNETMDDILIFKPQLMML